MSWIFVADDGERVHYDVPPQVAELEAKLERALGDTKWYTEQYADCADKLKAVNAKLEEHERRWKWLTQSILAVSKEGHSEWASVVLAVINKCRYEPFEGE